MLIEICRLQHVQASNAYTAKSAARRDVHIAFVTKTGKDSTVTKKLVIKVRHIIINGAGIFAIRICPAPYVGFFF